MTNIDDVTPYIGVWILSMVAGAFSFIISAIVLLFVIENSVVVGGVSAIIALIFSIVVGLGLLNKMKRGKRI